MGNREIKLIELTSKIEYIQYKETSLNFEIRDMVFGTTKSKFFTTAHKNKKSDFKFIKTKK
jgi:hypothetical protein